MTNVCTFLSVLLSTTAVTVVWLVGFFLLLRGKGISDSNQDAMHNLGELAIPTDENLKTKFVEFLREAVRLAEERMGAQENVTRVLQWKAALLGTLCLVMIGFLLSGETDTLTALFLTPFAVIFLALAIGFCAQTINFADHGQLGLHPDSVRDLLQKPHEDDLAVILHGVLNEYHGRINKSEISNVSKAKSLRHAMWLWVTGAGFVFGALTSEGIKAICGWLIM